MQGQGVKLQKKKKKHKKQNHKTLKHLSVEGRFHMRRKVHSFDKYFSNTYYTL